MEMTKEIFEKIVNEAGKHMGIPEKLELDDNEVIESLEMDTSELEEQIGSCLNNEGIDGTVMTHTVVNEDKIFSIIEKNEKSVAVIFFNEGKLLAEDTVYHI